MSCFVANSFTFISVSSCCFFPYASVITSSTNNIFEIFLLSMLIPIWSSSSMFSIRVSISFQNSVTMIQPPCFPPPPLVIFLVRPNFVLMRAVKSMFINLASLHNFPLIPYYHAIYIMSSMFALSYAFCTS
jgi:hypothetical protein